MYKLTRQQAAEQLNISTRSIDRYIKAGKIRAQKIGKIVYVNENDINNINGKTEQTTQKIIINKPNSLENIEEKNNLEEPSLIKKNDYEKITKSFEKIYSGLREDIQKKDEKIQHLSIELGRMTEIIKNSVNLIDHKKSQFLLEESKNNLNKEVINLEKEKEKIEKELKYEKNTNKLLIFFLLLLLIVAGLIWFYKI